MTDNQIAQSLGQEVAKVVTELRNLGWKAEAGKIRGLPYVRVYSTGAQIRVSYDSNQWAPKRWFWYVADGSYDWSWAGDFHGPISDLGPDCSADVLSLAVQAVIFDPCALPNIHTLQNLMPVAQSQEWEIVCPVCKPNPLSKTQPLGEFDTIFESFSRGNNLAENQKYQDLLESLCF